MRMNSGRENKMSTPLAPAVPGTISIGSFVQANKKKSRYGAILTLHDVKSRQDLIFGAGPVPPRAKIGFEDFDLADRNVVVATSEQVAEVIAFGRAHVADALLVHCTHGVGRSAACALAILADRAGKGHEAEAVAQLFAIRPEATPNLVVVALADQLLGLDGALVASLAAWEASVPGFAQKRADRISYYEKNRNLYAHH